MSRAAAAGIWLVAGALAALLLAEYRLLGPGPAPAPRARRSAPAAPPAADAQPGDLTPVHVATVLGRPLFRPDRRPPAVSGGAAARVAELPRLTAILINGGGRRAIFADDRKPIIATEGDRVGVYVVQAIGAGQVTVYGPEGQRILRPSFDLRAGDAPVPPGLPQPVGAAAQPRPAGASILDLLLSRGLSGISVPGLPAAPGSPISPTQPPPQGTP